MGIANHKVNVIRIAELLPHPNAETLSIVKVEGYQVVVKTADYKVGDLAIYIQPDSICPQIPQFAFLWENLTFPDGIVPEKKRRVTVRRFRKEYSEGLLMPLADFTPERNGVTEPFLPQEGDDVADRLGIYHYEPHEDSQSTTGDNEKGPGRKQSKIFPRSLKGWFYFLVRVLSFGYFDLNGNVGGSNVKAPTDFRPVYDVEALKNYANVLQDGEEVIVTEKIHGSNARYTFTDGKMFAGSRKLWKSPKSNCIWRQVLDQHPWIEQWCRLHPDFTLYGEVVPTQKGYDYGCKDGQAKFFVFDILSPPTTSDPNSGFANFYINGALLIDGLTPQNKVPYIYNGPYADSIKIFAEGLSMVAGAHHIREGIVIRPLVEREARNLGRVQLKVVSNKFLEKELSV
jgi:hypothetical protein